MTGVRAGIGGVIDSMLAAQHLLEMPESDQRTRHAGRQRRLLASLAEAGQQTPIVVIATDQPDRYVVIDGYKRITALQQLGRDTVEAVVWPMGEADTEALRRLLRSDSMAAVPRKLSARGRGLIRTDSGIFLAIWIAVTELIVYCKIAISRRRA